MKDKKSNLAVRVFAEPIVWARDKIADVLVRLDANPNVLTVLGTIFTLVAGFILARGAEEKWGLGKIPSSFWAGLWLIAASAMDMLDGAVARVGNKKTTFGGILDSSLDRVSDIAIFSGIAIAFARIGNLTFVFLSLAALCNAVMISYIKARAECEVGVGKLSVGYWQRGERMVGILVACFFGHISTLVWMMAILPMLTAGRRLWFCYLITHNKPLPKEGVSPVLFWRFGRNSWPFAIVSAVYILILALVDLPAPDFLGDLFKG